MLSHNNKSLFHIFLIKSQEIKTNFTRTHAIQAVHVWLRKVFYSQFHSASFFN